MPEQLQLTAASRIMLPTYPLLAGVIGVNYVVASERLLYAGPFFVVANAILPLTVWGAVFIVVALLQVLALSTRRIGLYQAALALMAASMVVWALVGLSAALVAEASYTSGAWPAFVAVACVASFRSINLREF